MTTSLPIPGWWTTTAVTLLPPDWVAVREAPHPDGSGELLYTTPCPAVLLQHRIDEAGDLDTRVIAAMFDGPELIEMHYSNIITVTSEESWQDARAQLTTKNIADREQMRATMLKRIAAAGSSGIEAAKLVDGFESTIRACWVRQALVEEGFATFTWCPSDDPETVDGRVCVYRLSETAR
ncbi:hypothetical protein PP613_21875 [Mycobacteroides abscessus]|nr:hypothetical protein [Mycobacteroides abscessus]MDM2412021.1 hypothetical protein [Mycobacteroides abscessus]